MRADSSKICGRRVDFLPEGAHVIKFKIVIDVDASTGKWKMNTTPERGCELAEDCDIVNLLISIAESINRQTDKTKH